MSLISGLNSLSFNDLLSQQGLIQPNQISGLVADYNPQSLTTQSTPAQIGNLVGWWRADQGITLTSGKVSSWSDLSGNGNTLIQNTAGNRPTTSTSATYNNQAVVNFASASTQFLNNATISVPSNHTVFIVGNFDATSSGQYMCDGGTVNTNGVSNNADTTHVNIDGSGAVICTGRSSNSPFVFVAIFSATGNGYVNCNIFTGTTGNIPTASTGFYVGIAGNLTDALNGSVAEVAIFNSPLTQSQSQQLIAYASQRYGITISIGSLTPAFTNDSDAHKVITQATYSAMPTLNTSDAAYNNQPSLSFARASTQALNSGTWTNTLAQPYTLIAVANYDGAASPSCIIGCNGNLGEIEFIFENGGTNLDLYAGNFLASGAARTSASQVVAGIYTGSSSKTYVSAKTATATGNAGTSGIDNITIGTILATDYLNGKIARILIYNRALLQSEINQLLNYCGVTYGISIGN